MWSRILLGLVIGLWCSVSRAGNGAEPYTVGVAVDQVNLLSDAEKHMEEGHTDQASTTLTELYVELSRAGKLTSPFALWVRLRRAKAWERSERYIPAVEELFQILAESERQKLFDIRARALLQLALIQEEQSRPNRCRYYLQRAWEVIEKHELVPLLSVYHIRMASYQRLYGDHSKAMHHAQEALTLARRMGQPHEEAWGHLLLSMGYREHDPDLSAVHLKRAIALQAASGRKVLALICALHLIDLHLDGGDVKSALRYSDTTLHYIDLIGEGHSDAGPYIPHVYDYRANIYRRLGQPDSTIYYLDLSRAGFIRRAKESTADRIANIEDRFESEKKQQYILEQADELRRRLKQQRTTNVFAATVVLALIVLGAYYLKLRAANQRLAMQSLEINDKNERLNESLGEQQLLRGELHHRIKNNLQVIVGILDLQSESIRGEEERARYDSLSARVHSMAAIHDILYGEDNLTKLPVDRYVSRLCENFIRFSGHEDNCACALDIPAWTFTPVTLIPLGTMVNELMMNTRKYAPLPGRRMQIYIALKRLGTQYLLTYRDNGPGFPPQADHALASGLGLRLLRGIARQLNGSLELSNDNGAVTRIYFQADEGESAHDVLAGERTGPIRAEQAMRV